MGPGINRTYGNLAEEVELLTRIMIPDVEEVSPSLVNKVSYLYEGCAKIAKIARPEAGAFIAELNSTLITALP